MASELNFVSYFLRPTIKAARYLCTTYLLDQQVKLDRNAIFLEALAPVHDGGSTKKISDHFQGNMGPSKLKGWGRTFEKKALSVQI